MRFPAKKPRVAFRLPYLLIELFYIGKSVVQIDGQARFKWLQVTTKFSYPRCSGASERAPLILLISRNGKYAIIKSYQNVSLKQRSQTLSTFFFLLFPTTLYKKKYDVTVLVNEFLFSYHSQLRMPLAWSRGDEVSVFSSTQVLKEDPFCLNPVHLLQKKKTKIVHNVY